MSSRALARVHSRTNSALQEVLLDFRQNQNLPNGGTMRSRLVCVFSAVLLSVLPVIAQTQASMSGVIHDSSGAVIPGVSVTLTNPATNFLRSAISNEAGVYNLPGLQPGRYNIKVELPGFRTVTQNDVELQIQQSARLDFVLQVGEISQTVEVSGASRRCACSRQSEPLSRTSASSRCRSTDGTSFSLSR